PLGFALIPVNTSLTLADNAKVTVEGGNELPSGMLPSGQTFVYAPLLISGASITFGANSLITSDRTTGYAVVIVAPNGKTINLPVSSAATVQTQGGIILIGGIAQVQPPGPFRYPNLASDSPLSITTAGGPGTSTLNLLGGPVIVETQRNVSDATITIN